MVQTRMSNPYLALPLRPLQALKRRWMAFLIELESEVDSEYPHPFQRILRNVSSCLEEMETVSASLAPRSYVYHFDGRARSSLARLSSNLDQVARHLRLRGAEIGDAPQLRLSRIREEYGRFLDSIKRSNRRRSVDLHRTSKFQERILIFPIELNPEATS